MYTSLSPRPATITPRGVHVTVETHTRTATPVPSIYDDLPGLTDVTDDDDKPCPTPTRVTISAGRGNNLTEMFDRISLSNEASTVKRREDAERALRLRDRFEDEPMPEHPFPFRRVSLHVVTCGRKTGVFSSWHIVAPLVEGYSGKAHEKYKDFPAAWSHWREACLEDCVFGQLDDRSLFGIVKRRPPPIRVPSPPLVKAPAPVLAARSPAPAPTARSFIAPRAASACGSVSAGVNATADRASFKLDPSLSLPPLSSVSSSVSSVSSSSRPSPSRPRDSTKGKRRASSVGAYAVIYGRMPGVYRDRDDALSARGPHGHYIPCSSQQSGEERMAEADALGEVRFC